MVQLNKQHFAMLLFFMFLIAPISHSREQVLVGVAHFPPFIINEGGTVGGLAMEMLKLMNAQQSKYDFVALPTLPTTRHHIFDLGRYDMSMFDNLDWDWKERDVDASDIYLRGGEIYITQAQPGKNLTYFEDFKNKKMVGIEGYHYGFADFNSDPAYLAKNFNIELTRSNLGSIQMILAGRGDIAVVTKSFLAMHLNKHPGDKDKLLLSSKFDQVYQHRIILRRHIQLTIAEINALLAALKKNGKLDALWDKISLDTSDY